MGTLIDASVFIAAERGKLDLRGWLQSHGEETFSIAAITLSELWHGVHRATPVARRRTREAFVRFVETDFPVVPFDAAVAHVHAEIWADLAKRGNLIGAHDLLIAATGVAHDLAVATLNAREFSRVPRLRVVDPRAG